MSAAKGEESNQEDENAISSLELDAWPSGEESNQEDESSISSLDLDASKKRSRVLQVMIY